MKMECIDLNHDQWHFLILIIFFVHRGNPPLARLTFKCIIAGIHHGKQDSCSTCSHSSIFTTGQLLSFASFQWVSTAIRPATRHLWLQCPSSCPSPPLDPRIPSNGATSLFLLQNPCSGGWQVPVTCCSNLPPHHPAKTRCHQPASQNQAQV